MGSDGADPGAFLYMCLEFKPAGGGTPGEIGPRQLINSGQRYINQQRVFLNFSLRPKGWLKENRKKMSSEDCFLSVQKTGESGEQCPVLVSRLSFLGLMFRL